MKQYNVTGMSCDACRARVEKAVSAVPGVESCAVSLLTNSMGVTGTAPDELIIKAVTDAGYGASAKATGENSVDIGKNAENELKDTETPKIRNRLIASIILMIPLLYVSMGHMMFGFRIPETLNTPISIGVYELLLSAAVMVVNQKFFISGFKSLIHKAPNMDTLVAMGSAAAFCYSVSALFSMIRVSEAGNKDFAHTYMNEFYFESAAMILTLITVGKLLESISKGRTTDALKGLMKLTPKTAVILKDGIETEVNIDAVKPGDLFVIRAGNNIPVDGTVHKGSGAVNESAITGESIPVDKKEGDVVTSATTCENGYLICEATRVGKDTTLSQIIKMVSDAATTKAPIAKIADKVSGIFVPTVIGIALITLIAWMIAGYGFTSSLPKAICVLVISCPCALGLATPVAIMVGNGVGAKNGILFKTAASLEETGKVKVIALDKTGTVTKGEPVVTGIYPANGTEENVLLKTASSLEEKSEHPLAKAVCAYAKGLSLESYDVKDVDVLPGNGLIGTVNNVKTYAGNKEFIENKVSLSDDTVNLFNELSGKGETPLFFSKEDEFLGIISVADVIKEDTPSAIRALKDMGLKIVMLTGDNEKTAAAIAGKAGIDEVTASVKPGEKEAVINRLKEFGKVAMVGDGINDAPALTSADIGIAIGAGSDIAIDAADVVLVKSRLIDVVSAVKLSRATLRNIHENLFWAFFYNVICIPLAAGVYTKAFGISLNPMIGAAAMSLSSFCVVMNALRLNLVKLNKNETDNIAPSAKTIQKSKEDNNMKISVKGMMCAHCEAHVKKALEALPGVESATASHEENLVTLTLNGEVSEEEIKKAVEDAGYEYAGIV